MILKILIYGLRALPSSSSLKKDLDMPLLAIIRKFKPLIWVALALPLAAMSQPSLFASSSGTGAAQPSLAAAPAPFVTKAAGDPVSLELDDGVSDTGIGVTAGDRQFLFLNRFTPSADSFAFQLKQIQVYFRSDSQAAVGDPIRLVVYENTIGNTDPADGATFLASFDVTVVDPSDTWNVYDLPSPVALNGPGDVLIGVIALKKPGTAYFPAALDQTSNQGRSWIGLWTGDAPVPPTLPSDDIWSLIDSQGWPGNWMIRGYGEGAAGPVALVAPVPAASEPGLLLLALALAGLGAGVLHRRSRR